MGTTGPEILSTSLSQTVWNLTVAGYSYTCPTIHGAGSRRAVKELPATGTCYVCGTYFVLGLETAHILHPLLDSLLSKGRHCEITSYSVARTNKRPSHTTPSNSNDYKFGNLCRCLCACTGNWNVFFCGQFASKGSCFRYCNVAVLQGTFKDGKCYILMWSTFLNISVFSRGL